MRFSAGTFHTSEDFFTYLRDTFDTLYAEGEAGSPKMMSVGLHCRLVGRPGRIKGLADFLAHIQSKPDVWIATRGDIAAHWRARHPAPADRRPPHHAPEGRLRPALRQHLRALPLDRRARLRPRARPRPRHRRRPRQRPRPHLPLRHPGRTPRRPQSPPRPRRQAGGRQTPHRRIHRRAGRRRPRLPHRRRAHPLHRAQRRLPGQVRLPLHHRRARPRQGAHPAGLRDPRRQRPRPGARHRLRPGRAHRAPPSQGHAAMKDAPAKPLPRYWAP